MPIAGHHRSLTDPPQAATKHMPGLRRYARANHPYGWPRGGAKGRGDPERSCSCTVLVIGLSIVPRWLRGLRMQFSCRSFRTSKRMDKRLTLYAVAQRSHMAASPTSFMEAGCCQHRMLNKVLTSVIFDTWKVRVRSILPEPGTVWDAALPQGKAVVSRIMDRPSLAAYRRGMFPNTTPQIRLCEKVAINIQP